MAPGPQKVGETIPILSGRLTSATLLEDRRAAILGLRSFAKQYPASVASGALRSLISSLDKDGEDVDTVKVVLETLLMLFNPNHDSPEASEEIALWLADEFTQRQEKINLLLDFLEKEDFYSRLYSLQLLSAILSARTERTEECVFSAPLGISRLVAILDERREAVRNEAIVLLTYLTPTSTEIQKLVAFENAFDRIFNVISEDGGLAVGGRVVEDCLILLANLLRLNPSNQTLFRETGCMPKLTALLKSAYQDMLVENGGGNGGQVGLDGPIAPWAEAQRNRNVYALLAVIRLFLASGSVGTPQNQDALWHHGLLLHALQLAFNHDAEIEIRTEALVTCADIIRGNTLLQEHFAQFQVPSPPGSQHEAAARSASRNGNGADSGLPKVYVIDGLLDVTLGLHAAGSGLDFNLRHAACECLKAYFYQHSEVRLHFLSRAIEGHQSGADETANVLTTLLAEPPSDPYRYWFAAVIMFHLVRDSPQAKAMAMGVTEGDESSGEEVVTSIQIIAAHLISGLARDSDERVAVGCLMLLLGWLFEDLDCVNDFLAEGSNVQGLIQAVAKSPPGGSGSAGTVVRGLCAALLGVVYEFSTKDSPVPRATLQPILLNGLGRDNYMDRLSKLRSHQLMRDFEVLPQRLDASTGQKLPDVYFDAAFVEFFKDNYSRILRAIERESVMEVSVLANGVQKGISREMVDELRATVEERGRALEEARQALASLDRQLGQERADHRRSTEAAAADVARLKSVAESVQRAHEEELSKLKKQHVQQEQKLQVQNDQLKKTADLELERSQRRADAAMADSRATISRLEYDLLKSNKAKTQELQAARDDFNKQLALRTAAVAEAEQKIRGLEQKTLESDSLLQTLEKDSAAAAERAQKSDALLKQAEAEKKAVQGELDDLLMVFGDLEEKVSKYKKRLIDLGEALSDAEDDDEGGEQDDEEDEDSDK